MGSSTDPDPLHHQVVGGVETLGSLVFLGEFNIMQEDGESCSPRNAFTSGSRRKTSGIGNSLIESRISMEDTSASTPFLEPVVTSTFLFVL